MIFKRTAISNVRFVRGWVKVPLEAECVVAFFHVWGPFNFLYPKAIAGGTHRILHGTF